MMYTKPYKVLNNNDKGVYQNDGFKTKLLVNTTS